MRIGNVAFIAIIAALLMAQCTMMSGPRSSNPFERIKMGMET